MIELWTVKTANGQKATVLLELLGLEYQSQFIDLMAGEHLQPEFLAINPVGRAPVIRDHSTEPAITVYGTMAIALYLADKTGRLMPSDAQGKALVYERSAFLASDLSPALSGQFMMSIIKPIPEAADFFSDSSARLLGVLDGWLAESEYIAGSVMSIADAIGYPAAASSAARLEGGIEPYRHIQRWVTQLGEDPAVQRGMAASA